LYCLKEVGIFGIFQKAKLDHLLVDAGVEGGALELILLAGDVAVDLVAVVVAVDLSIAAVVVLDALARSTPELALRAVAHLAVQLVTAIAAVVLVVAAPTSGNTLGVVALKVGGVTGSLGCEAAAWFVLAIGAIEVVVATPSEWNTPTRIASESKEDNGC